MHAHIITLIYSQLWIVVPHPPLSMDLLEHQPAQPTCRQWPTPVTLGMRSPLESPQQWLPVWLVGCGSLYQLVHVCEVDVTDNTALTVYSPTQLWIVAPHPPFWIDLLEHPPAQPTKGQWPTPVSVGLKSPMESPWLPVWLVGPGDLYQLVNVCIKYLYSLHLYITLHD